MRVFSQCGGAPDTTLFTRLSLQDLAACFVLHVARPTEDKGVGRFLLRACRRRVWCLGWVKVRGLRAAICSCALARVRFCLAGGGVSQLQLCGGILPHT